MSSELTMCLCNYARPEQLHQVIDSLLKQTVKPKIFVWNNDTQKPFKDDRVDWIINSSRNGHTRHVPMLWQQAATEFVGRMDDDLYFADDDVLADALPVLADLKHRNQMLGAYGVRLYTGETYKDGHHIATPKGHGQLDKNKVPLKGRKHLTVDVLKGRILLAKQNCSHTITTGCDHYHTDIHISTSLAGRHRFFHYVSGTFWNCADPTDAKKCLPRLLDFPLDDLGYCDRSGHYEKRAELCQEWADQCLPNKLVKKKPEVKEAK